MSRVPNAVHEAYPWVIRDVAPDFRLLDVWALPVEGGPADFGPALESVAASFDPAAAGWPTRLLFAARLGFGALLRWDVPKERPIPGCRETALTERLPAALRGSGTPLGAVTAGGFAPLYRTDREWAAELSNGTVHGVLHLAWADQGGGRFRAHLAVYVKPRGRAGEVYLKLIDPFRHLVVYPALIRHVGRAWAARADAPPAGAVG